MGIALSLISAGDVALLYDSHLAAGGERSRGTAVLGNATLAGQTGTAVSALLGGAVVTLSYGHLLWANAILSFERKRHERLVSGSPPEPAESSPLTGIVVQVKRLRP